MASKRGKNRFFGIFLTLIILLSCLPSLFSQDCGNRRTLNKATEQYRIGRFYRAIDNLIQLKGNCWRDKRFRPYREETLILLAKSFIALDSLSSANKVVEELIEENPYIEVNEPLSLKQMVNKAKIRNRKLSISSVSKSTERIYQVAASTMIITEEQIRQRGYFALDQIFDDIPGFEVYRTMGNTFANIYHRGYRTDNTTRTIFMINGIEDNDFWGNISNWSRQIPLSNIARIEIVYGGNSSIYGKNAMGGIINIITKDNYFFDEEKKPINISVDGGLGEYRTKYGDMTITGKLDNVNVEFSFTGRYYISEEFDENKFTLDDYELKEYLATSTSSAIYDNHDYRMGLGLDSSINSDILVNTARTLDQHATSINEGIIPNNDYVNSLEQYFGVGKIRIGDFTFGYQWWESTQSSLNASIDFQRAGKRNRSIWNPSQSLIFARFERPIGRKLLMSNIAQFRTSEVGNSSKIFSVASYQNGQLTLDSLTNSLATSDTSAGKPGWQSQFFYQRSKQFRNELKFLYSPSLVFDLIGGVDYRFSTIQGDFKKYIEKDNKRIDSISNGELLVSDLGESVLDTIPGGNILDYQEIGVYLQGTYAFRDRKDHTWINTILGGRFDYSRIGVNGGFGTVFSPKLGFVFTPTDFLNNNSRVVLKGIYSESFYDASARERFSVNVPDRLINNPDLKPERVRNTEIILGYYQEDRIKLEISYFYAVHSDIISQRQMPMCRTRNSTGDYFNFEGDCEQIDIGQADTTHQYVNLEELSLSGIQSTISAKINSLMSMYANHTFYSPKERLFINSDISTHQFNIGLNLNLIKNKLNINARYNYMGVRTLSRGLTFPSGLLEESSGNTDQDGNLFNGYSLFHGTITLRNFISGFEGLQIQGIANNIGATTYLHPGIRGANGIVQAYRTPQRSRSFMIRLIYDLN